MKRVRNNPWIRESFPGENHFRVFCSQRNIVLSLVIYVDHDWNRSPGVLKLYYFARLYRLTVR